MTTSRCFDCDDHGHLTTEHCWFEGQVCRCGETPTWNVNPVNPCPLAPKVPADVGKEQPS